jgi:Uma2 family endonuclease
MATHQIRTGSQLALGPDDAGRPVSAEEFADAVFQEPWRYERENGRLLVMPPDGEDHVDTVDPWLEHLYFYRADHREVVRRIAPNAWIRVDQGTDRIGDIGVYLADNPQAKKIPDRVPDLIFEIVSPGRTSHDRDYITKRAEYERLGVKEYVIIDRFTKQVTVLTLAPDGYHEQVLTAADRYTSPLLPGLEIVVGEVLNP